MTEGGERRYLDDVPVELQDLLYEGRTVEAVKFLKERKRYDLKQAKEEVDRIQERMKASFPDVFLPSGRGCLGVVLFCVFLGLLAACINP